MSSYSSNSIRFTGMASGLDTASIVDAMMLPYKTKLDNNKAEMQTQTWKQELYRGYIDQIKSLQSKYFDVAKQDNYLLNNNSLNSKKVTFGKDVISGSLKVTTGKDTANGNYSVNVIQKATGGSVQGNPITNSSAPTNAGGYMFKDGNYIDKYGNEIKADHILDENGNVLDIDGNPTGEKYTYDSGGRRVDADGQYYDKNGNVILKNEQVVDEDGNPVVDEDGNPVMKYSDDKLAEINEKNTDGTFKNVQTGAKAVKPTDSENIIYETSITELGLSEESSITINGKEISLDGVKTIRDLVNKVNGSDAGVKMDFTQRNGFSIETKATGDTATLSFGDDEKTNEFLSAIQVDKSNIKQAQNAIVEITYPGDSTPTRRESSSNQITYDGITITLTDSTKEGDTIDFTVESDTAAVVDKIKAFVDDFNKLLTDIHEQVYGSRNTDYPPLTDDEKATMTTDEIEKYEEKAKVGLLKGDQNMQNLLQNLRSNMFSGKVGDTGIPYKNIGFTSDSDWNQYGKISFDADKFAAALEENPDLMEKIFTSEGDTIYSAGLSGEEKNNRLKECGIFQRISDILDGAITTRRDTNGRKGSLVELAGIKGDMSESNNTLTNKMKEQQTYIDRLLEQYTTVEARYYKQFTAMETAMNELTAQQASLASYFTS